MTDLEIYHNAPADASEEELSSYLEEMCGGDVDLRRQVEALFGLKTREASTFSPSRSTT